MKRFLILLLVLCLFAAPAFAQTNTPTSTPTHTPTLTPTPDVRGSADRQRVLNQGRIPSTFDLGDLLMSLWRSRLSGGAPTVGSDTAKYDIAAGKYAINGVPLAASAVDEGVLTTAVSTTASQFRKATLCLNIAGTYRVAPGAVSTVSQAAALKPACSDSEVEVMYFEFPNSFVGGTTALTLGMLKQAATLASQVRF